jgi:hypothetical protein
MGLKTSGGGTIYLSIQNGKIARRVQEPTATSKSRVIEGSGKLIHEELYDSVEGMLTGLATREGNYGKELMITINDQVESYQLQIKLSSSPASAFLRALPNVAPEMPLLIIPKIQEKDGVRRTSIILSQGNKGVKWAFTKDNPGDLPPMKKIKVKGKETWDDSEQLEFFEKMIAEYSNKLKATGTLAIGAEPLDDDGIPF